jgi:putative ABC transport system substrate-binding protein
MARAAYLLNADNPSSTGPASKRWRSPHDHSRSNCNKFPVRRPNEFESAFERMEKGRIEGVVIDDEGMFNANIGAIAALAAKRQVPAIGNKELAQAGGLAGYGVDYFATFRRAAAFVDKILKDTPPAHLPIEQATKFEFVLNLKTAKALGLDVPPSILLRADEVIA